MIPGADVGWVWTDNAEAEPDTPVRQRKDIVAFSLLHGRRFALIAFMVLAL